MKRPNRKDYIGKSTKIQLIADQEKYIDFIEKQLEAINYTQCCESDSEQLPSFLYKHEGGLYFKHLEDTDITEQWNEYLKTR